MPSVSAEPASPVDVKALAEVVRGIRSAWRDKDYAQTLIQSRTLLEYEPGNTYGLIHLARAAAHTGDWADVVSAGGALVRESPRDAFNAARKLCHAGHTLEAATIFADLDIGGDWFDAEVADLAWREAVALLKAAQAAERTGDVGLAKVLLVAGARIAPRSQTLFTEVRRFAFEAKNAAKDLDRDEDPLAYIDAWRELLWLDPSNILAATKIASAHERLNAGDAVDAWLNALAIEPDHERANERLRRLAIRNDLEDRAIQGLLRRGRRGNDDPLVRELEESRDRKAREAEENASIARRREALARANAVDRDAEPRRYLAAWKDVLALDPTHMAAARKVASVAQSLGEHSEHVEALIALLEITPDEAPLRERLVSAAQRAGMEQRALEYLAHHGLESLSAERVEGLRKRVFNACKRAVSASDFNLALTNFRTLALVSGAHESIEPLRLSLAKKAASSAREAEKLGDLAVAVPLAEQVLEIVPDHPVALRIVARDLLRQKRFSRVIELCQPRMKPGAEYEAVQKLVERATEKLAAQRWADAPERAL